MNYKNILAKKLKIDYVDNDKLESMFTMPPNLSMGDYALPCFAFAKVQKCSPMVIATSIAEQLQKDELIEKVEVVNGYVNIYLNKEYATKEIVSELTDKHDLGASDIGKGKRVCVEFSSVNVAKNPHIGHFSGTVIGASIARLYEKVGYEVKRLNYLGDYGTQFGKLICAYLKWGNKEDVQKRGIDALQELYVRVNAECETDEKLLADCREVFKRMEEKDKEILDIFEWFKELTIADVKKCLFNPLKIDFDDWRGEQYYAQYTDETFKEIEEKQLAKISQGALIIDLTEYNLDIAMIKQSNGTTLYLTRDIPTAIHRYDEYRFDKCIYITGAEQKLHFAQLFKIVELMGYDCAKNLVHLATGRLRLPEGKLSSRKGNQALAKDIIATATQKASEIMSARNNNQQVDTQKAQDIGLGALIFAVLKSAITKDSVFVLEDALNFDGETGPYLMYTHARCASIVRKANINIDVNSINFALDKENSWELVSTLNRFNSVVIDAYTQQEPSVISRYLLDLASVFNRFYHDNRIISDNNDLTIKNVAITKLVMRTLKEGLNILGIVAPDEM